MPLIRETKLPPAPELGQRTFWDYFPKRSMRRILFLLLALAAVIYLKTSSDGNGSFGGLFESPKGASPQHDEPSFHLQVKPARSGTPGAP